MDLKTGDKVWLLANGWWRRGVVLAKLRTKVIIRYGFLGSGRTRETRRDPIHDYVLPGCLKGDELERLVDRPVAEAPAPELAS